MKLKIKKIEPSAKIPCYAHSGDAGMDLFSLYKIKLKSGEYVAIRTGISIELPKGYVGLIWDKSGLSINNGLKVLGGVIDSGYRGEIKIGLINLGKENHIFNKGDKIAQMLIQKVDQFQIIEVTKLSKTNRGTAGFGSTGRS